MGILASWPEAPDATHKYRRRCTKTKIENMPRNIEYIYIYIKHLAGKISGLQQLEKMKNILCHYQFSKLSINHIKEKCCYSKNEVTMIEILYYNYNVTCNV